MTVHIAATFRNSRIDVIGDALDGGSIEFYDGAQPANANTAVGAQVLLATLTFNAAAFPAASAGSATAAAITSAAIGASGTAAWARIKKSDGTVVCDCSVGTSGTDITVPTTTFTSGVTLSISSFILSEAA